MLLLIKGFQFKFKPRKIIGVIQCENNFGWVEGACK